MATIIANLPTLLDGVVSSNVNVIAAQQAVSTAVTQADRAAAQAVAAADTKVAVDGVAATVSADKAEVAADLGELVALRDAMLVIQSAIEQSELAVDADRLTTAGLLAQTITKSSEVSVNKILIDDLVEEFHTLYLGGKWTPPTTGWNGNELATGMIYYDIPGNSVMIWVTGNYWVPIIQGINVILATNNLGDLTDKAVARTNLDVYSTGEVDILLAAQDEASEIAYSNVISGLVGTNVQTAIDEIEGRVDVTELEIGSMVLNTTATDLTAAVNEVHGEVDTHVENTIGAHAASAISNVPGTKVYATATDVQSAINAVDAELVSQDGRLDVIEGQASTFSGNKTFSDNVTINGSLFVNGANTTVNSTTVTTADNTILLNSGEVGTGVTAGSAGLEVDRGLATNYAMILDESDDSFKLGESEDLPISSIVGDLGTVTITVVNNPLVAGQVIQIIGTTLFNGTYTIATATSTTITIASAIVGSEVTGIVRYRDLQKVATREDAPLDGGHAKWDEATNKFITSDLASDTQTLTNKTLTLPKVNEAVDLTATSTELNQLDGVTVGGTIAGDIATIDGTQTLTNKTIDDISNFIGAQHIHYKVKATEPLAAGDLLLNTGYNSGEDAYHVEKWTVARSIAAGGAPAFGLNHSTLATGDFGLLVQTGQIININTSTLTANTIYYVSSTADGLVSTKPTEGWFQPAIYVMRSHVSQGAVTVNFALPTYIASTTQSGYVQLTDSLSTTSSTLAATATAVKTLQDAKIAKLDIVTNLTTADDTKVLSAAQGKILQDTKAALAGSATQEFLVATTPITTNAAASKAYVDAQFAAGDSNVSLTKTFEHTITVGQIYPLDLGVDYYIPTSTTVTIDGVVLDEADYIASNGQHLSFAINPPAGSLVKLIAYGGADVYTKSQAAAEFVSHTEVVNALDNTSTTVPLSALMGKTLQDNKVAKVATTDNAIVRFNGTTGEVQDSEVYITDTGNLLIGTTADNGVDKLQVNGSILNNGVFRVTSTDYEKKISNIVSSGVNTYRKFATFTFTVTENYHGATCEARIITQGETNAAPTNSRITVVFKQQGMAKQLRVLEFVNIMNGQIYYHYDNGVLSLYAYVTAYSGGVLISEGTSMLNLDIPSTIVDTGLPVGWVEIIAPLYITF